jgi:hypothetical protein
MQPSDELVYALAAPSYAARFPLVMPASSQALPSLLHPEHEEMFKVRGGAVSPSQAMPQGRK